MTNRIRQRRAPGAAPFGVAVALLFAAIGLFATGAAAQFFEERFPFDSRPPRGLFGGSPFSAAPPRPADFSRAPAPRKYEKNEGADLSTVLVLGDSLADWLGYGLEQAFSESPEVTVTRRARAYSGLIANHGKLETRGRNTDWVVTATDMLAKEPANYVVVLTGLGDRDAIREPKPAARPEANVKPATPAAPEAPSANADQAKPDDAADAPDADDDKPPPARGATSGAAEFRSERWVELYTKRVDNMIAALKAKGVPVFWVGLPPIRGARSMGDVAFLNDLYRARAEKAGIVYIDVWDGFVDESNRFAVQGPDFEGQIRRLRTSDGVHFTQAGARKLAHFVERELRRAMTPTGPVAIALPVEPNAGQPQGTSSSAVGVATPRPLAGPVIPLNATGERSDADELAGAGGARQSLTDAAASRVLVRGEILPIPAGRADDFTWPRRAPLPLGADPVVATTTLPMTPMVAERPQVASAAAAPVRVRQAARGALRPPGAIGQAAPVQREVRRQSPSPFFFFFGGR
jgi:hypothetical protein